MTNQNNFIYLPIYLSDYVSESRKLTMVQRGALTDLSVLYFQENLKINYTKEQIFRLVFAFSKEEQDAVEYVLENYFTKTEEKPMGCFWVSNHLNKIAEKVRSRLVANRNNGKKGGRPKTKPMGYDLVNPKQNPNETILNEIKLNEIKLDLEEKNIQKRNFQKPSLEEIKIYCRERNNSVNPEKWLNYYESNGWKVGKNPMKDWKAAVRTWEGSSFGNNTQTQTDEFNASKWKKY